MIWGDSSAGSVGASNGVFWDESVPKPMAAAVKSAVNGGASTVTANTKIVKSQTVSVMQSTIAIAANASAKNVQPAKVLAKTVSTVNVTNNNASEKPDKGDKAKKPKGKDAKKSSTGIDETNNDEFGKWCSKTLAAHSSVIDGEFISNGQWHMTILG